MIVTSCALGLARQAERLADQLVVLAAEQLARRVVGEAHKTRTVENDDGFGRFLHQRHARLNVDFCRRCGGAFVPREAALDRAAQRKAERARRFGVGGQAILGARFDGLDLQGGVVGAHRDDRRIRPERHRAAQEIEQGCVAVADIDDQRVDAGRQQRVNAVLGVGKAEAERARGAGRGKAAQQVQSGVEALTTWAASGGSGRLPLSPGADLMTHGDTWTSQVQLTLRPPKGPATTHIFRRESVRRCVCQESAYLVNRT